MSTVKLVLHCKSLIDHICCSLYMSLQYSLVIFYAGSFDIYDEHLFVSKDGQANVFLCLLWCFTCMYISLTFRFHICNVMVHLMYPNPMNDG